VNILAVTILSKTTTTAPTRRARTFPATTRAKRMHEAAHVEPGTFEAVVSTYGSPYSVGYGFTETIQAGAFKAAQGRTVAVMLGHDWSGGPLGAGVVNDTSAGLAVKGRLYVDTSERARVCHQAMLDGALDRWSVAFMPEMIATDPSDPLAETIVSADLIEVSLCLRGANPDAQTIDVRARSGFGTGKVRLKSGWLVSAKPDAKERRLIADLCRRYKWFADEMRAETSGWDR
jgi:HK97 family phage prohead protease